MAYTSNGIKVVNAKYICREVSKRLGGKEIVLDGEFFAKNWNMTNSLVMTQSKHSDAKKLKLRCFDTVSSWDAWTGKSEEIPLRERKTKLNKLLRKFKRIRYLPHIEILCTPVAIKKHFGRQVKLKYEGGVYKDPDAAYPYGKSNVWLRLKPKSTDDAKIIGTKDAKKGKTGKYLGLVGSIECRFKHTDGRVIQFNMSGMDDELRRQMTKLHKRGKLVGRIVEVEHEGITVKNKLRFPQFVRFRDDKD